MNAVGCGGAGQGFQAEDLCTCRDLVTRERERYSQTKLEKRKVSKAGARTSEGLGVRGRTMLPKVSCIMLQSLGFSLGDKGNHERDSSKLVTGSNFNFTKSLAILRKL